MGLSQHRPDAIDDSVSHAVIEAVAERDGVDVTDVVPPAYPALYTVVDPDALDAVFAPTRGGVARTTGSVTFEYTGYTVTVHEDGAVELD